METASHKHLEVNGMNPARDNLDQKLSISQDAILALTLERLCTRGRK